MTWDELRDRCLSFPGASETFPFAPGVSVFKAANGKVFAIASADAAPLDVSLKCDPDLSEALRASYQAVVPGYHLNKRHWITVTFGRDLDDRRIGELLLDSHDLVAGGPARR